MTPSSTARRRGRLVEQRQNHAVGDRALGHEAAGEARERRLAAVEHEHLLKAEPVGARVPAAARVVPREQHGAREVARGLAPVEEEVARPALAVRVQRHPALPALERDEVLLAARERVARREHGVVERVVHLRRERDDLLRLVRRAAARCACWSPSCGRRGSCAAAARARAPRRARPHAPLARRPLVPRVDVHALAAHRAAAHAAVAVPRAEQRAHHDAVVVLDRLADADLDLLHVPRVADPLAQLVAHEDHRAVLGDLALEQPPVRVRVHPRVPLGQVRPREVRRLRVGLDRLLVLDRAPPHVEDDARELGRPAVVELGDGRARRVPVAARRARRRRLGARLEPLRRRALARAVELRLARHAQRLLQLDHRGDARLAAGEDVQDPRVDEQAQDLAAHADAHRHLDLGVGEVEALREEEFTPSRCSAASSRAAARASRTRRRACGARRRRTRAARAARALGGGARRAAARSSTRTTRARGARAARAAARATGPCACAAAPCGTTSARRRTRPRAATACGPRRGTRGCAPRRRRPRRRRRRRRRATPAARARRASPAARATRRGARSAPRGARLAPPCRRQPHRRRRARALAWSAAETARIWPSAAVARSSRLARNLLAALSSSISTTTILSWSPRARRAVRAAVIF